MTPMGAPQSLNSRQLACLVVLCVLGVGLRLAAIDRSFWLDEVVTVLNVSVPDLKTLLIDTAHDNQPPLYNVVAFAWIRVFGSSELAVRSLSLLFGVLVLGTPWLARRSLAPDQKLVNCAILCLMTFPVRYAQEARNYSLLLLLSAVCLYSYYEATTYEVTAGVDPPVGAPPRPTGSRQPLLLYVGIALLAFTHIFGVLLALSFIAVMLWRARTLPQRAGLAVFALLLTAATLGPLLLGGATTHAGGNFWIKFGPRIVAGELLKLFTPVGLVLFGYAVARWRTAAPKLPLDPSLAWALVPPLLMMAGALVVSLHTPIFLAHYLIGVIPAYALLMSWLLRPAVSGIGPETVAVACALLLIQALALTFSPYLFVQENLRQIARTSVALDSPVCYVVPTGTTDDLGAAWSYYVVRRFGRPDLRPLLVPESTLPEVLAHPQCGLWADAHLVKRGVTVLHEFPGFKGCQDVPLGPPGVALASALIDCRGLKPSS